MYDIKMEHNDVGQKIIIQMKYEDLEVLKFPASCTGCPNGFMKYNCGRNYPMKAEDGLKRPSTCKLKLINLKQLYEKDIDINRMKKMIAFIAQMLYFESSGSFLTPDQEQQLENIADELGFSKLSEDEFRY